MIPPVSGTAVKSSASVDDFKPDLSSEAMDFFGIDDRKSSLKKVSNTLKSGQR